VLIISHSLYHNSSFAIDSDFASCHAALFPTKRNHPHPSIRYDDIREDIPRFHVPSRDRGRREAFSGTIRLFVTMILRQFGRLIAASANLPLSLSIFATSCEHAPRVARRKQTSGERRNNRSARDSSRSALHLRQLSFFAR